MIWALVKWRMVGSQLLKAVSVQLHFMVLRVETTGYEVHFFRAADVGQ